MADTENKTNEGPSTSQKSDLTRAGSLINPPGTSIKGRNDTAENKRGGDTSGRGISNNNNFGRSVTTRLTVSGVAKEANKSLLKTPETKTHKVLNDTAEKQGGRAPTQRNVSGGVRRVLFPKTHKVANVPKTYKVANVAKNFMKERVPSNAERRLVRKALESKFGRVRIPSASPPNKSKALIVYTGPKSGERTAALPNRINEPVSGETSGSASSEKVPIIKIKVLKKREQKPRARRMRRPAKRESPKPKTPETETEKTPSGSKTAVKKRSPPNRQPKTKKQETQANSLSNINMVTTVRRKLFPTGSDSQTSTPTTPTTKTTTNKKQPSIKEQHREAKKQGAKTLSKERRERWKREGTPKARRSLEPIFNKMAKSPKTPPGITKSNLQQFLAPFKQPISIQFAPSIKATGGAGGNATIIQTKNKKNDGKKKTPKKFNILADPASAYRKSVVASKRKEIMPKLRTPTVGQRKKHVIELIDKELRLMKVPKDIERKMISLYSKVLSEKQIKQLFGGRSTGDVKKILKKQVDYFKKKKR